MQRLEELPTSSPYLARQMSTVNRRQQGKVPTPFCWFGQGLTVKDPRSLSEDEDEQLTRDFTQVRATRRLTALRPALIVLGSWMLWFYSALGLGRGGKLKLSLLPYAKAWPTDRCSSPTLSRWKKNRKELNSPLPSGKSDPDPPLKS